MGSPPKMFVFNTHFILVKMVSVSVFLYRKMALFGGAFWVFFCTYLVPLFGFIPRKLYRFHYDNWNCSGQENNVIASISIESEPEPEPEPEPDLEVEPDSVEITNSEDDESCSEEESSKCFLEFRFHTYEEFSKSYRENNDSPSSNANKYEFMAEKGYNSFMEEPEVVNSSIMKEFDMNSNDDSLKNEEIFNEGFLLEKDFMQQKSETEAVLEETQENSEVPAETEDVSFPEDLLHDQDVSNEVQFFSEDFTVDSDSDSITSSLEFSVLNHLIDSNSDEFLSDRDFGGEFEIDTLLGIDWDTRKLIHDALSENDFDEENAKDVVKELQNLEKECLSKLNSEFLSENDFNGDAKVETKQEESSNQRKDLGLENSGKPNSENSSSTAFESSEDSNGLETLWEHQDLIEQLKMEIRKVRATGLPTILEESESPKFMEDLQPWKIDEKFQHEDTFDELHKFYKTYRERMRKFDILNYQKMYAMGVLQSTKDPLQSPSSSNSSVSAATTSIFLDDFQYLRKRSKKVESDPTVKFIRELHSDLEIVYVGQMCLSWEFLHWQYEKALELWESDPHRIHGYNQVAGEFQQFQVLMQRFIENEPFQGPRVQNYAKNRCVLRNLLQVPVIREDNMKDKKKTRRRRGGRGNGAITSDMLVEIMEESIRIFWQFIRADKHEVNTIFKGRKGTDQIELQDPAYSKLLAEVRTTLQKKEKKLKDLLRSGNCILKRFQKNEEDNSDQVLYFFSQVDMKLVSRVLNMSSVTTDQLVWCHNKLSMINFVNRKIHVEPSFLLFPC